MVMHFVLQVILATLIVTSISAQANSKIEIKNTGKDTVLLKIDPKTLSFKHPVTGDIFTLYAGESVREDIGGVTKVPRGIQGFRHATSSYWEPRNQDGAGYQSAESALLKTYLPHYLQFVKVQYQPDTEVILITENISDASPHMRHILFRKYPNGGYSVAYLCPRYLIIPKSEPAEFHELPSEIKLLPRGRANVNGKIGRLSEIPQSASPFSIGG